MCLTIFDTQAKKFLYSDNSDKASHEQMLASLKSARLQLVGVGRAQTVSGASEHRGGPTKTASACSGAE